jgi:outer membrane protein OmpA-like peptidoglycan-associated protein
MRCNPWRWLWGLLLIAPLSWIALHLHQTEIENDLRARSVEALEGAGLGWARTAFDGRDATLTGLAPEEGDPLKAADLLRRVWGVRVVDARTDLIQKVQDFVWSATRTEGKRIKLSGFVPGEPSRRSVLSAVKATLPGFRVEDTMQLARGAPSRDVFLTGVGFGLKQLAALKEGRVELSGTTFSIAGQAPDQGSLKAIRARLKSGMPEGISLGREALTGPVIANYVWDAALAGNQIVMSGYAPSTGVRDQLFQHAKKLFPRHAVIDRMEIGEGAPVGFAEAATVSIAQLFQLEEGKASLSGRAFTLQGRAQDETTAGTVRTAFARAIGAPFTATAEITAPKTPPPPPEPVAAAPEPEGPYVTRARIENGTIELTGDVPSEDERIALVAATRSRFPDLSVKDSLEVRPGGDPGWQACLLAGIGGLGHLVSGDLSMTGLVLDLAGKTDDDEIAEAVPAEVRGAASQDCITTVQVESSGEKQAEARRLAQEAARLAEEARRKAEDEARLAAEAEARRQAEEEARRKAEEEARLAAARAAEEARRAAARAEADKCEKLLGAAVAEGSINFKRADATLESRSKPTLDRLVKIANECPAFRISIEGHTDSEGIPERNNPLSERRAKAVVDYLVDAGVDPDRLSSVGFGAERPIADNDTAEGRAKNRRIEFRVIAE